MSALTTVRSSSTSVVKRETSLSELADRFLLTKADRAPRTVDTYRQTIEHHIKPKIGSLAVSEATTERLGRFISEVVEKHGHGAAKACRAVLSGMMGVAARSDAILVNPVREIDNIARLREGATAIPLPMLPALLSAVRADTRLNELDAADVIVFLAGTGCRLGEVLAVRWSALDLDAGTVAINANVIRARGKGVLLQDHTKTRAGVRTIAIPQSLVKLLRQRQSTFRIQNNHDLVFPTMHGNIRDPRNTSRDWRMARERVGYPGVTTHSFRKTVATALDQSGLSAREIAEYLGHANPSLTQDVYMAKNTGGVRAAETMNSLLSAI
ncbi:MULTISPECIES: site-specific integrase [unclassified Cryobacterium]|uniref:site-specific integrase n=1 Tax=unclassified Cryobacterium TaxID=2649013 RepID=UPI0018C96015|nr:site-specific integrase [Cryobacterium sp. CAN_C3]